MKHNPFSTLNKLFDNKRFMVAFSIFCAVVFWLIIDISENPTREITLSDITVTISDQTDDKGALLKVIGENERDVAVTISGPGYIVSNVTKKDISVSVVSYADVNRPGTYVLNLTANVDVGGCQISKISPSYIKVDYDYDTMAEIPVEVDVTAFQQYLPADREIYKSNLKSNADSAEITALSVTGPSEVIRSIAKVVATPVLPSEVTPDTQNFNASLVFCDSVGNPVDASELEYNTDIYVRAVVYKVAEVSLLPTFSNLPSCYASQDSGLPPYTLYSYNERSRTNEVVTKVTVRGPVETVDSLVTAGLKLSPIDFMQVTPGNTSFNVSFLLDEGVEVVDGTEEITVSLKLGSLKTTEISIDSSQIKYIGLPEGMTASSAITNKAIKVVICYDYDKTRRVTADNIVLTVDLTGITTPSSVTKPITVVTSSPNIYAWATSIDPADTIVGVK